MSLGFYGLYQDTACHFNPPNSVPYADTYLSHSFIDPDFDPWLNYFGPCMGANTQRVVFHTLHIG